MRRMLVASAVTALLLFPAMSLAEEPPSPADYQRVEHRFREAITAWAYQQWWTLWEMGNDLSRLQIPRDEFVARMRRAFQRSAAGRQVEDLRVMLGSRTYATVVARLGVENSSEPERRTTARWFTLKYEEGEWKVTLQEFVGLSMY